MKIYSWILAVVLSAVVSGCSSSEDEFVLQPGSTDLALIQDRVWVLSAVQDDSGNQIPVIQEPGIGDAFEFRILLTSGITMINGQEVNTVGGFNVCKGFDGGYTLIDGLLSFVALAQNDVTCDREREPISMIYQNVIFTFGATSMLFVNTETDVLQIVSGNNEVLFFEDTSEPLFPGVVGGPR